MRIDKKNESESATLARRILTIFGNAKRLDILHVLRFAGRPMRVREIVEQTQQPQSTVSNNIAFLQKAGVVVRATGGYQVQSAPLRSIIAASREYTGISELSPRL